MLLDARNPNEVPDRVDAVTAVIGGGPVGLYVALTLARAGIPVLVCEAAGLVADISRSKLTGRSIGRAYDGVTRGRAFGLGGTSVLWGGQLTEFEPRDMGSLWPIEFSELSRWYDKVYSFLSVRGRLPVAAYRSRLGAEKPSEEDVERFFTFWLPQPNFVMLFRQELFSNPSLRILLNAPVCQISFDGEVANSVQARTVNGRNIVVAAKRFIFAMGTIENSRFFLSTQRTSAVPWRESRLIGCYFQDHLAGRVATVKVLDERKFRDFFENGFVDGLKLQPKLRFSSTARKTVLNGVNGAFSFDSGVSQHLAQLKALVRSLKSGIAFSDLAGLPANLRALSRSVLPLVIRYVRHRRIMAFFDRGLAFHVQCEQIPNRQSKIVVLDEPLGPDGLFPVGVNWSLDGREIAAINMFTQSVDSYLRKRGIARLEIDESLSRNESCFLTTLSDTYHQCGGLRMASDPADGVVDGNCRVWGTRNLYVAGASVFPTSSHANSTLTALALAARLASEVKAPA